MIQTEPPPPDPKGDSLEVLGAFLKLGCTAFGGPIAHLGYFREAFVGRRRWLTEAAYADLVALCQFLPGPASSQVGFAIGLHRAGPAGALAAWLGFTAPSALLMTAFAFGAARPGGGLAAGALHGLKLVAVAVVAQAVFGMARTLTPDPGRGAIAIAAAAVVTFAPAAVGQIAAIGLGAVAGWLFCKEGAVAGPPPESRDIPRAAAIGALAIFLALLLGGPLLEAATHDPILARFDAFYRSGALVFGGGHVVLPLLKGAVVDPGWVSQPAFLAGYGAAQAAPGPLFTFAAYLGAAMGPPIGGLAGAGLALAAIFLPGLLALVAALPFWAAIRSVPAARSAMSGANAAVVGLLATALYDPVWTGAVFDRTDFVAVAAGFVLLAALRTPPLVVVLLGLGLGVMRSLW